MDGLAPPLVINPYAVVVLVQVDRRVIAGLTRVAAVRLERGDGGARRDVLVATDWGALLPCGGPGHTRRLHEVDAVARPDHHALERLGASGDVSR